MKKSMMIVIASLVSMIFAEGISGVSYFRFSPGVTADGEDHGFYMDRAYLTYKKNIAEGVSFKFQSDVQNENGEALYMYIKNAKMDYKIAENTKLSVGLQGMNVFNIQEKTWGKRFISKSAMDRNKWSASADLGLGLYQKLGSIGLSILYTNGEGYKKNAADDNEKLSIQAVYGEKRLDKNDGFNLGAVFSTLAYETDAVEATDTEDAISSENKTASVMGLFAGYAGSGARVGFEYNMGTDLDLDDYGSSSSLMSVTANYNLPFGKDISAFARYDMLDPGVEDLDNTTDIDESSSDDETTLLAGLIFKCANGMTISPNVVMSTVGDNDAESTFHLTFQLKF